MLLVEEGILHDLVLLVQNCLSAVRMCPRGCGGGGPLREGDRGLTLFRSHFSNILSALGRVFQIFCPALGPIFKFLSILGQSFVIYPL